MRVGLGYIAGKMESSLASIGHADESQPMSVDPMAALEVDKINTVEADAFLDELTDLAHVQPQPQPQQKAPPQKSKPRRSRFDVKPSTGAAEPSPPQAQKHPVLSQAAPFLHPTSSSSSSTSTSSSSSSSSSLSSVSIHTIKTTPLYKRITKGLTVLARYAAENCYYEAKVLRCIHSGYPIAIYDIQFVGYEDSRPETVSWRDIEEDERVPGDVSTKLASKYGNAGRPAVQKDDFGRDLPPVQGEEGVPGSGVHVEVVPGAAQKESENGKGKGKFLKTLANRLGAESEAQQRKREAQEKEERKRARIEAVTNAKAVVDAAPAPPPVPTAEELFVEYLDRLREFDLILLDMCQSDIGDDDIEPERFMSATFISELSTVSKVSG